MFYNASPQANGFVIYGVQKGKSYIILSKVKVALIKTKTLSMMELLAVHTEFKALTILWSLTLISKLKTSIFLWMNRLCYPGYWQKENQSQKLVHQEQRLKVIWEMKEQLSKRFVMDNQYKYVPSVDNPADLLSCGIYIYRKV